MANVFKNAEQRKHWNKYNNDYCKRNYKTVGLRLHVLNDKDIIEHLAKLEEDKVTVTDYIKELLRREIKKAGN